MKKTKLFIIVIALLSSGLPGFAAVVTTGTFQNPGGYTNVTLSGATTTGFSAAYNTTQADTRFYSGANLNGTDGVTLGIGQSLSFSFDWSGSLQFPSASLNQAISFGFDVGNGLFRAQLDSGTPAGSLLYLAYGDTYQFGAIPGAQTAAFSSPVPASGSYLQSGNTVSLATTLTRTGASDWTFSVTWGGETYTQTIAGYIPATNDFTINSVWVGSGAATGSYFSSGDGYTVSNAVVTAVPEPGVSAFLMIGAVAMLLIRPRLRKSASGGLAGC